MAIKSGTWFRRLAHTVSAVLGLGAMLAGAATAQTPISSGSVIPFNHDQWGQIYQVQVARNGSVLFLDTTNGAIYQLSPGATTVTTLSAAGAVLNKGGYYNESMVLDAKDTLYIGDRYDATHIFRVAYNPATGTWPLSTASAWQNGLGGGINVNSLAFLDSAAKDGSGTLFIGGETNGQIMSVPVDASGNVGSLTVVAANLQQPAEKMTVDHAGNIIFSENPYTTSARANGLLLIPAGQTNLNNCGAACTNNGTFEASLPRLDPPQDLYHFYGITVDAAGNLYVTSEVDSYGGNLNAVIMIPNESGSPTTASAGTYNFAHAQMVAPVSSGAAIAIDPRGFLWIPTGTGGWSPTGDTALPGTLNVVQWQPGAASLGAAPVGTATAAGTVFYDFNVATTLGSVAYANSASAGQFSPSAKDPNADPTAATPQPPCTAGKPYLVFTSCSVWTTATPTAAGLAGAQLQLLDGSGNVLAGSTTAVSAIGQGPAIASLAPAAEVSIARGLNNPRQVAGDSAGNSYVADATLGVFRFAAGSTTAAGGTAIGTGLIAPTGVAVDATGNVYIGDSGKVLMVPLVAGALSNAAQTTLATGLGNHLNLAVDGNGNVFAADTDNARVVHVYNAETRLATGSFTTVGSGFTAPSAVGTDAAGNLFVADGANLSEITPFGQQTAITGTLAGNATGLAVDASDSVYIAQTGGVIRIPNVAGQFNVNSTSTLAADVSAPSGVGLDGLFNLYVTSGSGSSATLTQVGTGGNLDFGQTPVGSETDSYLQIFNVGNTALTFSGAPTFGGAYPDDFGPATADLNGCDTTGATALAAGNSCEYGLDIVATQAAVETATVTVPSNATNAPALVSALTGTGENNLPSTTTTLVISPATGLTYPASTTATVTVVANNGTTVPVGNVSLVVENTSQKTAQTLPTVALQNATATFNLSKLGGGTYTVIAKYLGSPNAIAGSRATQTLNVALAVPTIKTSTPATYVLNYSTTTITAQVTSSVGAPTGTITFLNGASPADPKQAALPVDANGNVTFSTSNLAPGTYKLTAVYNGDPNFATVTSAPITFQVIPMSILITATPAAPSTTAGTPLPVTLNLQSLVGFGGTGTGAPVVSIQCDSTTLPQYSECTFDNPTTQIPTGGSVNLVVTLSTNVPVNVGSLRAPAGGSGRGAAPLAFAGISGLGILGLLFGRRTRLDARILRPLCLALLLAGASAGVVGCTNNGYTQTPPAPHVTTPSGTYNISIIGTNSQTHTQVSLPFTLPVTVK